MEHNQWRFGRLKNTHNFLLGGTISKVESGERLKLQVQLANGENLLTMGGSEEASVRIQGNMFHVSFQMLKLRDYGIALGVQWFRTLGPIIWDFLQRTMRFQLFEKDIKLQQLMF